MAILSHVSLSVMPISTKCVLTIFLSLLAQSPIKYDNSFIAVHKRLHRTLTSKGIKLSLSSQWPLCTGSTVKAAFNSRGVGVRFLSSKISFPIPLTRDPGSYDLEKTRLRGSQSKAKKLAWENSRHLASPPLISPRNVLWGTIVEIPYWRLVTTQIWV